MGRIVTKQEWCERPDVIGYAQAKGQAAVDCALANTGTDNLLFWVSLLAFGLILFGYVMVYVSRRGRL